MAERQPRVCSKIRGRPSRRAPVVVRAIPAGVLRAAVLGVFLMSSWAPPAVAQSLRGSARSLEVQNQMARLHGYTYLASAGQLRRFIQRGYLVRVQGNRDFRVHRHVSFPYARPAVRTFLQRLGKQYRRACGKQLVVTSLTRPHTHQPRNASSESVHPTGMAVDLRRSRSSHCRAWLERVLLSLERQGVLEATREKWPPHYHVVVFPRHYEKHVARLTRPEKAPKPALAAAAAGSASGATVVRTYHVKPGDSLWRIARATGVTVTDLRVANGLSSTRIHAGQPLRIPGAGERLTADGYDYRVQHGDSLWEIAQAHSTSVNRIRSVNGLRSDRLQPGQVLTLPSGS